MTANRLLWLAGACCLLLALPLKAAEPVDPLGSARWGDMKRLFIGRAAVHFDPRVVVSAPLEAEDPMQVPVTVDLRALGKVSEVVVFADFNPIVRILRFYPEAAPAYLGFRVKLQQSTPVRAAARTVDGVWHVGGTWVNTVGGGCTAPSQAAANPAWLSRLNEVSGRQWSSGDFAGRVRLRIIHPMDTGLVAGTPAFHIDELVFRTASGQRLMRVLPDEPVGENPVFTLYRQEQAETVDVVGRDNNGNRITGQVAP